jgi:hypothetical protein
MGLLQPRERLDPVSGEEGPLGFNLANEENCGLHFRTVRSNSSMVVSLDYAWKFQSYQKQRCLKSAQVLMRESTNDICLKRDSPQLAAGLGVERVILQSQRLLVEKNIEWEFGWNLNRFVSVLNSFVFFWPGREDGPVLSGQGHAKSQDGPESAITIRFPTVDLFSSISAEPLFCRFNSGSPRMTPINAIARPSPRGHLTFLTASDFHAGAAKVVEVVVKDQVKLPCGSQFRMRQDDTWTPI